MRWAFWRSSDRTEHTDDAPLPADVGLPATSRPSAGGVPDADGDHPDAERPAASPFSGASPDAAGSVGHRASGPAPTDDAAALDHAASLDPAAHVDPAARQRYAGTVVAAVQAVLDGDRRGLDAAVAGTETAVAGTEAAVAGVEDAVSWAAGSLAVGALVTRLPALSGVAGDVVFDEPDDDLLHAYADLLAERAEPLRRRVAPELRDAVAQVAHLAATAAHEQHRQGQQPQQRGASPRLAATGIPPRQQLVAACVLLAQTTRDGGGDADELAGELAATAGEGPTG